MRINTVLSIVFALSAGVFNTDASESAAPDTVTAPRKPHVLRPLEVMGVKSQPGDDGAVALTTISGVEARRLGIDAVKGISAIAPNFHLPDYGSRITSSIYVRGLGARMDQPVVGMNVDNIPFLNKDNYDFDIADIEGIEILRGAQAVLNGRNTMGGQINITTISPSRWQGFRAMAEYGSANTVRANAGYYGRISPEWAMSLSGSFLHSDGFFRNEYDGRRLDRENSGGARWKTEWRPSERLSLNNTATININRQGGYPYASLESGIISYNDTCSYRRTAFADGLTVAWAGKRVVVTSRTSVQYLDDRMQLDQDFLPDDYFTLVQSRRETVLTEDLFTRGTRGRYGWLGGVFAFYKSTDMDAPVTFKDTGIATLIEQHRNEANPYYPIAWDSRRFTLGSNFKLHTQGIALYHESSYSIGAWRFEAGIRCDIERSSLSYRSECHTGFTTYERLPDGSLRPFAHTPVDINDGEKLKPRTFVEILPKLSVSYDDGGSFHPYATFSKGYKAGGFNTQMFSDVLQQRVMSYMGMSSLYSLDDIVGYKPEHSFNYEAGLRTEFLEGRLKVDFAAFYISCTDQQLTVFPPGTTTGRIMTNAGRTRSFGAELSATWRPSYDLCITTSYGHTNATFRKYDNGRENFRGKRVPYAPANTFFISADWRMPFSFAGISPRICASAKGAGKIWWNEANTAVQNFYCLPSLSIIFEGEHWSLKLWGENLSGTRYNTFYFKSIGNEFVQQGRPRTLGVTLRVNFHK